MADNKDFEAISRLPEPLLHHVLSFLTTKEAAKTRLLSKSWLNAWHTRPTLELSYADFFFKKFYNDYSYEERTAISDFISCIERTLQKYRDQNMVVDTFKLKLEYCIDGKFLVEQCTKLALKYSVKNLDLEIYNCEELPEIVFEAESLVELYINSIAECKMMDEIRCHRLKRLYLIIVSYLDDMMLQKVISSCPLIEFLEICYCVDLRSIAVTKASNLKQLTVHLYPNQTIEVEAPALEMLRCYGNEEEEYGTEEENFGIPCGLTLLTPQYQSLKNLRVYRAGIDDNFFVNLANKFPNLEEISIKHCKNLRRIKISSPSLKVINLLYNKDLEEAEFDFPSIVRFKYIWGNIPTELSFTAASAYWAVMFYGCFKSLSLGTSP